MKFDLVNTLVALCISALLAWAGYTLAADITLSYYVAGVTFVTLGASCVMMMGFRVEEARSTNNLRATAAAFFFIFLIINAIFACFSFNVPLYLISNLLVLLIMVLAARGVVRSRM